MGRRRFPVFVQAQNGAKLKSWQRVIETMRGKRTAEVTEGTGEPKVSAPDLEAPQRAWAPRSRKSIREEEALQKECARCEALKRRAEGNLAALTEEKARALRLIKDGENWAEALLSKTLTNIGDEQRKLASFEEIAAKAQSNLDGFRADVVARAAGRASTQDNLVALAAARLEVDYALEKLLREALEMLKVREQTTRLMREQAAAIELTCSFEAGVPASLHEALSLEIVSVSKAWNARFLGEEENLKPYVVVDPTFEPEETLARKAIYHFGETVFLLEDEAREFLRDDRPQPGGHGWECLPPTLMTVEAFAAAQAESKLPGSMLSYFLREKHNELEQKRRAGYIEERRGTPVPGAHLHFAG
jgi:hypothetical protein